MQHFNYLVPLDLVIGELGSFGGIPLSFLAEGVSMLYLVHLVLSGYLFKEQLSLVESVFSTTQKGEKKLL